MAKSVTRIVVPLVIAAALWLASVSSKHTNGGPPAKRDVVIAGLRFDRTEADLGTVPRLSRSGPVIFRFTNERDTAVAIQDVRTSCGCTVASFSRDPVQPGERGEISAQVHARLTGAMQQNVAVRFEGVAEPIMLLLRGTVQEPVTSDTLGVDFGHVAAGTFVSQPVHLRNNTKDALTFTSSSSLPSLSVEPASVTVPPGGVAEFRLRLEPGSGSALLQAAAVLASSPGDHRFEIPVRAEVHALPVYFAQQSIGLGVLRSTQPLDRLVQLHVLGASTVRLRAVRAKGCEAEALDGGPFRDHAAIRLRITPPHQQHGGLNGMIEFLFDDGRRDMTLSVPVTGFVDAP